MYYLSRISIPLSKNNIKLYTKNNGIVSDGYDRIVIGKRGPYIEFNNTQLYWSQIFIPEDQFWRLESTSSYYIEYRTIIDNVKIYYQQKLVNYADYKIGLYYISPFDLYLDNGLCTIISGDEHEIESCY